MKVYNPKRTKQLHPQLNEYLLKKEEKNSTKTNISYDELILKKAIG